MFKISELAKRVGLSRTALLYYEKLGLLKGQRQPNGYRVYSDADRQRLLLLQRLKDGGLSLKECQACLDGKIERDVLAGGCRRSRPRSRQKPDRGPCSLRFSAETA